jgi:protocatechuate 3,4-dioxygenase beta subunit
MRRVAIPIALAILTDLAGLEARATEVAIVDTGGKPAARATVLCIDPASGVPLPVTGGRATVLSSCRRVRCDARDFLPGEVDLAGDPTRCVLRPATVVLGELPSAAAASGLEARLIPFSKAASPLPPIPVPRAAFGVASTRFTFPGVAPGRYALEIARAGGGWACHADLGPLGSGHLRVSPAWREPAVVGVRVRGSDGKPAAGVPVRAWSRRPATNEAGKASASIGAWMCAPPSGPQQPTDATGIVRLPVDLSGEALIVAGDWKDERGLSYQTLDRAPTDALTLTLTAPVRLRAKVEDDKDRPVACDAFLTELPPDLTWLTGAVPGAAIKAACDSQGVIALGPLPSTALNVEVRPRVGLPMRVAVDAPAPGATADLGVLRVRSGESIRVLVQDELGSPVEGARVTARGSAGILLSVAGVTGEDGGADLSGFPKNATIAFDVKAKGFLPAHETSLDLEASPFVVKLARGAAIAGTVRDTDGQPVERAEVGVMGEKSDGPRVEHADAGGAFVFDGVDDGTWRVTARAPGFAPSEPAEVEIRDHRSAADVTLTLAPAQGLSGRVVDGAGTPVAGARVRLVQSPPSDDLDGLAPIAEASSRPDGAYQVRAAATPDAWLVATKPGFGPCALRAPDGAGQSGELVLTLTDPASLVVHLPQGTRTGRAVRVRVRDGAGIGRVVSTAGGTELMLMDLAPGRGVAGLVSGSMRTVSLVARETAEVTLDAAAGVEGRVTFEGAPSPRVYVKASRESAGGQLSEGGGSFTDERGRYRIGGLGAESYRIVAVGEDGRAEAKLEVRDGETAHLDLALRSVRLIASVTDAASGKPVLGVIVRAAPGGKGCSSMMGTSSWGDPGELGFAVSVGSNGCLAAQTNAAGMARLALAAPGSYDVEVGDDAYETWKQALALVDGTTTKRIALTRKPDQAGDKPHVIANLRTDPPGLSGTISCIAGGNTNSSSPVAGRYDCGPMIPGPGEIVFHVEGFGSGRTAFDVPASGELVVDVDVPRGGTIVVPISQDSEVQPVVVDASGFAWSNASGTGRLGATLEDVPSIGRAWVFRDIPPGTYTVKVNGKARSPIPLASGGTAVMY